MIDNTTGAESVELSNVSDNISIISDQHMCRYCFDEVFDNFSVCTCKTALCRQCMERELCLTEGRSDHIMRCTVCLSQYEIQYLQNTNNSYIAIASFALRQTLICTNLSIQGRIPYLRERLALLLLMVFLILWTIATSYSIVDPGIDKFKAVGEIIIYLFLVFMDFCVGLSMIFFVKLVDCLQLTMCFTLAMLYFTRIVGAFILRIFVFHEKDNWKFIGMLGMCITSLIVITHCFALFRKILKIGWQRTQMRNIAILVGGKGPFLLSEIDRYWIDRIFAQNNSNIDEINYNENQDEQNIIDIDNIEREANNVSFIV